MKDKMNSVGDGLVPVVWIARFVFWRSKVGVFVKKRDKHLFLIEIHDENHSHQCD